VNEDEATRVRGIFALYLERQSLQATLEELSARNWQGKRWQTRSGHTRGGKAFSKTSLHHLLTNALYLGKTSYQGVLYQGEHLAIVDEETFQAVQARLKRNGLTGGRAVRNRFGALLRGLLRCVPCGCGMVHNHTTRKGHKRYRYYVCQQAQSRGWRTCPAPSVPAAEMERFVINEIRGLGRDPALLAEALKQARLRQEREVAALEAERGGLERELGRYGAEEDRLAGKASPDAQTAQRLACLQEKKGVLERRATEVREQLTTLKGEMVEANEFLEAFSRFDPVWEALSPREQARVVQLLVRRVDYDGPQGKVAITFHPGGIKMLANAGGSRGGGR
jgi:site-specific DNA recombinase